MSQGQVENFLIKVDWKWQLTDFKEQSDYI